MTTPNIRQPIMTFAADTVALNIICEELYGLIDNDERASFLEKKHTQFKTSVQNHTLFKTKTAEKSLPFGAVHTYIAHIRKYPQPPSSQ